MLVCGESGLILAGMDQPLPSTDSLTASLLRLDETPAPRKSTAPQPLAPSTDPDHSLPAGPSGDGAIELLRLHVPAELRSIWLQAERAVWEPWLLRQAGFLGRDLCWDPVHEHGVLLIRWASRRQWHAISTAEVSRVHHAFQQHAKALLRRAGPAVASRATASNSDTADCFPLLFAGEAEPELSASVPS